MSTPTNTPCLEQFCFAGVSGTVTAKVALIHTDGQSYEYGALSIPAAGITGNGVIAAAAAASVVNANSVAIPNDGTIVGMQIFSLTGDIYLNQSAVKDASGNWVKVTPNANSMKILSGSVSASAPASIGRVG